MKEITALVLVITIALLFVFGVGWLFTGNDLAMTGFFAPRYEQVRRNTFEQSKAYRQGMVQEIQNMQFQYIQASPSQKAALASLILHRTADFNASDMPPDLYSFVQSLRSPTTQNFNH